jgi:uncharacterized protein
MRTLRFAAVPALMIFGLDAAWAASFPCAKAATAVEKTICSDASISELDPRRDCERRQCAFRARRLHIHLPARAIAANQSGLS